MTMPIKPQAQAESPKQKAVVVLGLHRDDTLDIFVRNDDGSLNQAARINTQNGLDPAAMTAVMADLADVFGWQHSAAQPLAVPRPLVRAVLRADELSHAPAGVVPPAGALPQTKKKKPKSGRRNAVEMVALKEAVRAYVATVSRDYAVNGTAVARQLGKTDKTVTEKTESTIRRLLDELVKEGAINRDTSPDGRHISYYQDVPMQRGHPSAGSRAASVDAQIDGMEYAMSNGQISDDERGMLDSHTGQGI
jgi:hypothetical protein